MRHLALSLLGLLVFTVTPAVGDENRVITVPGMSYGLPFSPAVAAGDFVYLSGAIGNAAGTTTVTGDGEAQVNRTMENLRRVLRAGGVSASRVVASKVYLADIRHFDVMNQVYGSYFPDDRPPARTTIEAGIAIPNAAAEISMVAAKPGVEMEWIVPEGWRTSPNYAWGVRAGDTLFVSGMVSFNPTVGELARGDIRLQARKTLANVTSVLRAAEMGPENVAFCNVYLADSRDFAAMNEAFGETFHTAPPARATLQAKLADPDLRIEITCTAVRGEKKVVRAAGEKPGTRPFSPSIQVGDRLFLSGMVGRGADGNFPPDAAEQTRLTLDRLRRTLDAAGMSFDDVVSATVYLSDVRYYQAMNEVYAKVLPDPPPARATVGTPLMSPAAWVEIQMVAVREGGD